MRVRSKAILAAVAALAIASGACGKVGNLQARKAFKEANGLYQAQDYREAAAKYQEVLASDPNFMTPDGVTPYFFIANSYDNLYKPARKGEAENDAFLTKAIENYKIASEKDTNPKMRNLALDYLVYAYGPEKLNDPSQAEPIVQKKIQLDPGETTNYFMLAKIYEDNGNLDQAEAMYQKAKEMKPKDAGVYQQLAGYYQRQGEFEKLIAAVQSRAELEPNNPEAHYSIASYYWDEAYRNTRLSDAQKKEYTDKGLSEVEKALAIKPDYIEAIVYKGLLLRLKAAQSKDAKEQQDLLKKANQLQEQAAAMKKKQTEGK
ncbi:MAG TPA: tetratricopeptide repeat protein [Vicinamibacterales bacterium]|nr:tetratricopeptide repeat protein [Vicinamibacterales bacterium]